jgi:hypothetical protein
MLHVWYRTTGSLEITLLPGNEFMSRMILFGWNYYIGVIIIAVIMAARLTTRFLRIPKQITQILAMLVTVWLFAEIAVEWRASVANWFVISRIVDNVPRWKNDLVGGEFAVGYVVEAFTFFFVFILSAAEIFEIPACQRVVIEAKRKGDVFASGTWALSLCNCFKWISGQTQGLVWKKVR